MPELLKAGGTLDERHLYVERAADRELPLALEEGHYSFVLAPRQIGKSSLRARCEARLRRSGLRCATVDLTRIGTQLEDASQWYAGFLEEVADQLGISRVQSNKAALATLTPAQRWAHILSTKILSASTAPLVIFVDEIETILALPTVSDDFFAAVRALFNRRADNPELRRLTFCLLGVAAPHDLMQDPTRTPFNVGRQIRLEDFTAAEMEQFAPALERASLSPEPWIKQVYAWTSGHPYMTQRLFLDIQEHCREPEVPRRAQAIADFVRGRVAALFFTSGRSEEPNLRCAEQRFEESRYMPSLITTYRSALSDSVESKLAYDTSDIAQIELQICGLCTSVEQADGRRYLKVRNRIIQQAFGRGWLQEQERRRTRSEMFARALEGPQGSPAMADLDTIRKWARAKPSQVLTDFASYVQDRLRPYASAVRIADLTAPVPSSEAQKRFSLAIGRQVFSVQWKEPPPPPGVISWLRNLVTAFNSRVLGGTVDSLAAEDAAEESSWQFIARSPGRRSVLELSRRIANSSSTLLLIGPTGIGKEVLARDIHNHSQRRTKPFIHVNVASIPEVLFDAELFGVVRGSFTDAKDRPGLLERAHGGTLLLDEIGDLPLHLQPKLLQLLEGQRVRRIGAHEDLRVDVRIIAATFRDLFRLVSQGLWREDLYYRLTALCLIIPPVQPEDVAALSRSFLRSAESAIPAHRLAAITDEVAQLTSQRSWLGGVRELKNAINRFATLFDQNLDVQANWQRAAQLGGGALQQPQA